MSEEARHLRDEDLSEEARHLHDVDLSEEARHLRDVDLSEEAGAAGRVYQQGVITIMILFRGGGARF